VMSRLSRAKGHLRKKLTPTGSNGQKAATPSPARRVSVKQ